MYICCDFITRLRFLNYSNIFLIMGILSIIIAIVTHNTKRRADMIGIDIIGVNDSESKLNQRDRCSMING